MRAGDSLTGGTGGTANYAGCGRGLTFWSNTAPGGAYLDFVGSQANTALFSNGHHYGVGGTDSYGLLSLLPAQLTALQPTIIDLMIGTNDANATNTAYVGATSASNIASILAAIRSYSASARVLVTTIPAIGGGGAAAANGLDFNSRLQAVFDAEVAAGGKLHQWDAFTALNGGVWSGTYMSDNLHPNQAGYDILTTARQAAYLSAIAALG